MSRLNSVLGGFLCLFFLIVVLVSDEGGGSCFVKFCFVLFVGWLGGCM